MRVAAFIERDGLLNRVRIEHDFPVTPNRLENFQVQPEAAPLVRTLQDAGFLVIATTNPPGLSTGDTSRTELDMMHDLLLKKLNLDDIMICPHDEADCCPCRKPKPGLLIEAGFKWHVDLDRSVAISDKWQDAEAARIAGSTCSHGSDAGSVVRARDGYLDVRCIQSVVRKRPVLRGGFACQSRDGGYCALRSALVQHLVGMTGGLPSPIVAALECQRRSTLGKDGDVGYIGASTGEQVLVSERREIEAKARRQPFGALEKLSIAQSLGVVPRVTVLASGADADAFSGSIG